MPGARSPVMEMILERDPCGAHSSAWTVVSSQVCRGCFFHQTCRESLTTTPAKTAFSVPWSYRRSDSPPLLPRSVRVKQQIPPIWRLNKCGNEEGWGGESSSYFMASQPQSLSLICKIGIENNLLHRWLCRFNIR